MRILMVSPECSPLLKVGGLGDSVAGLALALRKMGHDVRLLLPGYHFLQGKPHKLLSTPLTPRLELYEWRQALIDIPIYTVHHPFITASNDIYGSYNEIAKQENFAISALLAQACVSLSVNAEWQADVLHLHDWFAGLVPHIWRYYPEVTPRASLLTLHNVEHQGVFSHLSFRKEQFGFPEFDTQPLTLKGQINLLAAAIRGCDALNTVSPSYAAELLEEDISNLAPLLHQRQPIHSFLNGVDYNIWNPSTDVYLAPYNYDADSLQMKTLHKMELQEGLQLPCDDSVALVVIIARLCRQKGFDLICQDEDHSFFRLMEENLMQFVVLGSGERFYSRKLRLLAYQHRNMRFLDIFQEKAAHKLEAAADFLLMPSLREPCGLSQLYSMRYGTLPVAHATGGLLDTIKDGEDGFLFHDGSVASMSQCLKKALNLRKTQPAVLERMQQRAMKKRFSWQDTAIKYCSVYEEIATEKLSC